MRSLPTLPALPAPSADLPCAAPAAETLSRRGFVSAATWATLASALASACGGGGDGGATGPATPTPAASGVSYANGQVTIPLASVPALAASGGFLVTNTDDRRNDVRDASGRQANVIVINVGTDQYRAFTSICTHQQCTVSDFVGGHIRCFCHGSEYDSSGKVLTGPAPRPLTEYAVRFDAATRTISVTRG